MVALVASMAGCGDDDSTGAAAGGSTSTLSDEESTFCDGWNAAWSSGDDSAFDEVLAGAPTELKDEAAAVRDAEASGSESSDAAAAMAEILDWTELHCRRGEAGDSERHIAPPVAAEFAGLSFCRTTSFPRSPRDERAGMVLYGEAKNEDPYRGAMLGVFWNAVDDGGHGGDGDTRAVTVRGQRGVAAPITVFQQTILPDLGTVIAWTEGDRSLGLYGRHWPIERADRLVELANRLEEVEGSFRIPAAALPEGYGEVFAGDPSVTSIILASSPLYALRYQADDGLLDVNGLQMTEDEFEAFRFFTIGVERGQVAGHDGLVGNAWSDEGPAVVTWREPDGLVVRIVGLGVRLETARKVAEQSRELSDDEWAALVGAEDRCAKRSPPLPAGGRA